MLPPRDAQMHTLHGLTMGTTWSVSAYLPEDVAALRLTIEARLETIVREMSHWEPGSALSRFNQAPRGTWHMLPPDFHYVLSAALQVAAETDGAFDPGLGDVVDRHGFGPGLLGERTPEHGCWRGVEIKSEGRMALQPGGVRLDFSSIAKGYAVDAVARLLDQLGSRSYLVEVGGECRARGVKHDTQPWWVEVERPELETPELLVALVNAAIATTGDYRKFAVRDGVRRPHTMDPVTGEPVATGVASVSVVHKDAMLADAYSTALAVMGADRGVNWANQHGIAAVFCLRGMENRWLPSLEFARMLD
jgi:thiamine biosynthesis lipoprotein